MTAPRRRYGASALSPGTTTSSSSMMDVVGVFLVAVPRRCAQPGSRPLSTAIAWLSRAWPAAPIPFGAAGAPMPFSTCDGIGFAALRNSASAGLSSTCSTVPTATLASSFSSSSLTSFRMGRVQASQGCNALADVANGDHLVDFCCRSLVTPLLLCGR